MANYLICYDIANPKRLAKVHKCTIKAAAFVQYSIYYFEGSEQQLNLLLNQIKQHINNKEDDLKAYPIPALQQAIHIGRHWLPEGIFLSKYSTNCI